MGLGWRSAGRRPRPSFAVLLLIGWVLCLPAVGTGRPAAAQAPDPFVVGGVEVEVEAGDSMAARDEAFQQAQRDALALLFRRLAVAERIGPGDLSAAESAGVLQSLRVVDESTSPGRYRGVFELTFRAAAVRAVLAARGLTPTMPDPADLLHPETVLEDGDTATDETALAADDAAVWLIVPVWRDAGGTRLWDRPNPWYEAWTGLDPAASPVAVVTPLADLEDIQLLSTGAAVTAEADAIAALAARYEADRAVVALATAGVGGIVIEMLAPGGESLTDEPSSVTGRTDDPAVLSQAVAAVLSVIVGRPVEAVIEEEGPVGVLPPLSPVTPGGRLDLTVRLDHPRDWMLVRAALAGLEPVTGASVNSLSGTAVDLQLGFTGSEAALTALLRAEGLDLQVTPEGRILQRLR